MKRLLITLAILTSLMPVLVHGQGGAGLFWDNSDKQLQKLRSNAGNGWDSGNKGTSALGQLESIAGRKVDTSRVPSASQPQRAQQAQPRVVHKPHTLSTSQQLGVSLFGAVLENVLMGSSSGNAAANAQTLEQQRIAAELKRQEELRKARILHNQWRAEWDERDQTTTDQLAGAFGPVSTTSRSTSFFGIPGGVDPKALLADVDLFANDTSVVDLRGAKSLTVPNLSTLAPQPTGYGYGRVVSSGDSRQTWRNFRDYQEALKGGLPKPAQWAAEWWWGEMPSIAWQLARDRSPLLEKFAGRIEAIPGFERMKSLYDYYEAYKELRDGLSGQNEKTMAFAFGGAQDFIAGRGNASAYWEGVEQRANEHRDDAHQRSFDEVASKITEGFETDEVEDYQSTVTPLNNVGPHPDTARWYYHKFSRFGQ